MRKRAAIARTLALGPEVVLFDEPTTGLDPIMIEAVDDMIALAKQQYQITSVIISHDMASTFRIGDRISMLYEGEIIDSGSQAVTGTGRSSCRVGSTSSRINLTRPISRPSGTPMAAAAKNPP